MKKQKNRIFLGLGSNLGDREKNLSDSLEALNEKIGRILKVSSVYETEPWGFTSEIPFLNMVVETETDLNPSGVLGRILMIEANLGRLRSGKEYASRIIDIDILLFGNMVLNTGSLVIPHPKLHLRRFALVPLNEIASGIIHPLLKKEIKTLFEECNDKGNVRKI